ncbi:MAG TPA: hypothetical protein VHQ65_03420 [Thermoanaerobaculia bacterium]|nr:hypothetical protein [Thermoanaerobaculia bacterium]
MSDGRTKRLRGRGPSTLAAWLLLGILALAAGGCAHTLRPPGEAVYDLADPPDCASRFAPPPPAARDVLAVRYLGAGGVVLGWRGHWVMTAPFFSNPGLLRARFGRLRIDEQAVADGLAGVPVGDVGAILAGHSHYDLGDLPHVAELAPGAALYVNDSGAHALRAVPELVDRLRVLEDYGGGWIDLADAAGRPLPIRVLALPSGHAPHVWRLSLFTGEIERDWEPPWGRHRFAALTGGTPFAFVVELLDEAGAVGGRLLLQDAAGAEGLDRLPDGPYDLAVLCMASAQTVKPYPRDVLARVEPRHVLVTHYENFFRHPSRPLQLVPLLYRWRAERFLRWTNDALAAAGRPPAPPLSRPCGPSQDGWTLPLPGEWLQLAAGAASEEGSP